MKESEKVVWAIALTAWDFFIAIVSVFLQIIMMAVMAVVALFIAVFVGIPMHIFGSDKNKEKKPNKL